MNFSLNGIGNGPKALREAMGHIGVTDSKTAFELPERLEIAEINKIIEFLYYACEITIHNSQLRKHRNLLLSPFATGFTFGSCGSLKGRMRTLEASLKRSLLLSNHIFLPNPFTYFRAEPFETNTSIARFNLATLIAHVYNLLPLIEDELIEFYPNALTLCNKHKELFETEESRIHECLMRNRDKIVDSLLKGVSAKLMIDDGGRYFFRFSGEHPIMNPGGHMDLIFGKGALPDAMKRRVGDKISRDDLLHFGNVGPILNQIEHLAFLLSSSAHFCKLDLMAADIAEVNAMQSANLLNQHSSNSGPFTLPDLAVPDFSQLSLKNLIKLMQDEADSINRFRCALTGLIDEVNNETMNLSQEERADLIRERLCAERKRLNKRLLDQWRRASRKTMEDVVMGGLSLALGMFSGLVGSAAEAFQTFGGFSIVKGLVEGAVDTARVPEDLKADSWYFLWKVEKMKR